MGVLSSVFSDAWWIAFDITGVVTLSWPIPAATRRPSGEKMGVLEMVFDIVVAARPGWTLQSIAALSLLPLLGLCCQVVSF